mmetsp:Transcript_22455/g.56753  ORF Transcript_22455/g.56753 Transcript_22455/m.56753 type:complete len:304 (-) Transcript_22455:265-1176(-)
MMENVVITPSMPPYTLDFRIWAFFRPACMVSRWCARSLHCEEELELEPPSSARSAGGPAVATTATCWCSASMKFTVLMSLLPSDRGVFSREDALLFPFFGRGHVIVTRSGFMAADSAGCTVATSCAAALETLPLEEVCLLDFDACTMCSGTTKPSACGEWLWTRLFARAFESEVLDVGDRSAAGPSPVCAAEAAPSAITTNRWANAGAGAAALGRQCAPEWSPESLDESGTKLRKINRIKMQSRRDALPLIQQVENPQNGISSNSAARLQDFLFYMMIGTGNEARRPAGGPCCREKIDCSYSS